MGLLDSVTGALFGGKSSAEKALAGISVADFTSDKIQRYLPPALRQGATGDILSSGVRGIGDLIGNPGGLSPNVAAAINPRLAIESANIAQNFRGIGQNQAGAAARGNVPTSIKLALQSALDTAQERAQRTARQGALSESESLRRSDLSQVYALLDAILQFTQSGKGGAISGLGQAASLANQRNASSLAFLGSLGSSLGSAAINRGGGGTTAPVP